MPKRKSSWVERHADLNGIPRDMQFKRSKNGSLVVRIGVPSMESDRGEDVYGGDRGCIQEALPSPGFTVRALRARSSEKPMLTPREFLKSAHLYAGQGNGSVRSWLQAALIGQGISTYAGYVISAESIDNIEQFLSEIAAASGQELQILNMVSKRMDIIKTVGALGTSRQSGEATYLLGDRGIFYVNSFGPHAFSCAFELFHYDITDAEQKVIEDFAKREENKKIIEEVQRIFMLVDYGNGDFNFHSNKIPVSSFKPENYVEENVKWMQKLKEGLFSPTATGRLTILQGPAGTGKTRYLRSLMQELGDSVAPVVLPVSLAGELSQPRMLGQITANDEFEGKSLLLIIEDGDGLLEKRDRASSVISDFLNIVDGLVGEIVNLHVVVTTNLQKKDFDPAITRPGRLHSILYFEALPYEQAAKVYKRETGEDLTKDKEEYTLAEIYALALNHGNGVREKKASVGAGQYL